ncbi:MAG: hypothetical protein ABSB01_07010 [Streptosporangiaceae bacterium]|jgi:hypothetical protein
MTRSLRIILAAVVAAAALAAGAAVPALLARPAATAQAVMPAADASTTIYACVTSRHTLARVRVNTPPACPAGTVPVQWQVQAGQRAPSPSPTATSPSPSPTSPSPSPTSKSPSPSPSPTSTAWAWCSATTGAFRSFPDSLALYNQEDAGSGSQTICGNSGSDWQASVTDPGGNTGILSYPDVQLNYNSAPPAVSSLNPAATSSFAETMNTAPGTSAEAAYDIWLTNGTSQRSEVMIWYDTFNRGAVGGSTQIGSGSFCGQAWQLWKYGTELIWYLPVSEQSGKVCPVQMLQALQSRGLLKANAGLSQFENGWEIASTGGAPETFRMTAYSVTGLPPGN